MTAQAQPTPQAVAFFEQAQSLMATLYARWQDEKEYEDIKDYAAPLKPIAERVGVTIVKMNKRPFGCTFKVGEKEFVLTQNSTDYAYKRVK